MGIGDSLKNAANKAKDHAEKNPDQVDKAFETGTKHVTDRTPDQYDQHVQKGSDAARDYLGGTGNDAAADKAAGNAAGTDPKQN